MSFSADNPCIVNIPAFYAQVLPSLGTQKPKALIPIINYQLPIPNSPCPMPNYQLSIINYLFADKLLLSYFEPFAIRRDMLRGCEFVMQLGNDK